MRDLASDEDVRFRAMEQFLLTPDPRPRTGSRTSESPGIGSSPTTLDRFQNLFIGTPIQHNNWYVKHSDNNSRKLYEEKDTFTIWQTMKDNMKVKWTDSDRCHAEKAYKDEGGPAAKFWISGSDGCVVPIHHQVTETNDIRFSVELSIKHADITRMVPRHIKPFRYLPDQTEFNWNDVIVAVYGTDTIIDINTSVIKKTQDQPASALKRRDSQGNVTVYMYVPNDNLLLIQSNVNTVEDLERNSLNTRWYSSGETWQQIRKPDPMMQDITSLTSLSWQPMLMSRAENISIPTDLREAISTTVKLTTNNYVIVNNMYFRPTSSLEQTPLKTEEIFNDLEEIMEKLYFKPPALFD